MNKKLVVTAVLFTFAFVPFGFAHTALATSCDPESTTNNSGCQAGQYCDGRVNGGTCELLSAVNPNNPNVVPGANSAAPASQASSNTVKPVSAFVALTQFPQIQNLAQPTGFTNFVNILYKICIGVGSVLAVLMIMYAGVEIMRSSGSVRSNEAAKNRIQNAIYGLILVLAPTIVFGIINPEILHLNFGTEFGGLKLDALNPEAFNSQSTSESTPGQFTGLDGVLWTNQGDPTSASINCKDSGGTLASTCVVNDGANTYTPTGGQCAAGQTFENVCKAPDNAPQTGAACQAQYTNITASPIDNGSPNGQTCSAANGFQEIPHGCCTGSAPLGNICCGKPIQNSGQGAAATQQPTTPPTPAPTSSLYEWQATLVNTANSGSSHVQKSGPFGSSQECQTNYDAFLSNNSNQKVSKLTCSCSQPISAQPSCPGH